MMTHVDGVVLDDELKGEVAIAGAPGVAERLGRYVPDHMQDMPVQGEPEREEVRPRAIPESLNRDARGLIVAWKVERGGLLQADEALQVVARRIDEVAEDFLLRPFAVNARRGFGFVHSRQRRGAGEECFEIASK